MMATTLVDLKEVEYFLKGLRAPIYKLINLNSKHKYQCPICNYYGPFLDKKTVEELNAQNVVNLKGHEWQCW